MIASDHIDFVGVDSFCGYPEGRIEYSAMIQGLRVDDAERMKQPAMRKKSDLLKRLIGLKANGEPSGADIDKALDKLTHETPEEREKRRAKEAKRLAKKKAEARDAKRRKSSSNRQQEEEEEEVTDEE